MAEKPDEEEVNLTKGDKLLAKQHVEKPYLGVEEDDKEYGTRSFISKEDEAEIKKIYAVIKKTSYKCCEIIPKRHFFCVQSSRPGRLVSCSTEDDEEIMNILNINSTDDDIYLISTMTTRPNSCLQFYNSCLQNSNDKNEDDNEIKNILNSNTLDEDSTSNTPLRPNYNIFRARKLKLKDENNCLEIAETNKISLNKSCETITENIMNRNDDSCSQADDVISSTIKVLDGPKGPLFFWMGDFRASDWTAYKRKIITNNISKEVEVMGSTDEVDTSTHERISKNNCTVNAVNKRKIITKNISKDVEVVGSADEVDARTHERLSKNTHTVNAVIKRKCITKNISKDVEVIDSTDRNDGCYSSTLIVHVRSSTTKFLDDSTEPSLIMDDFKTVDAVNKRKCITTNISKEVEVMGSTDEVDPPPQIVKQKKLKKNLSLIND